MVSANVAKVLPYFLEVYVNLPADLICIFS